MKKKNGVVVLPTEGIGQKIVPEDGVIVSIGSPPSWTTDESHLWPEDSRFVEIIFIKKLDGTR